MSPKLRSALSVRSAVAGTLGAIALLLAALLTVTTLQINTADDRATAENRQAASITLAEGVRQSSNDLTRLARLYVTTGEARYRGYYNDILAIRSGTAPRPLDYDNSFWDRAVAHGLTGVKYGPKQSLTDLLRAQHVTSAEFDALNRSRVASDNLADIERVVMNEADHHSAPTLALLRRLSDNSYNQAKATIMASIEDFASRVEDRTGAEVADLQHRGDVLLWIQIAILVLLALIAVVAFLAAQRRLVGPLARLTRVSREIAAGEYAQRADAATGFAEVGQLGTSFNDMAAAIQTDISRRQAAEAEAVEAQRRAEQADAAKSQFLATMSHEIRTPLNGVLGMAELLRDSSLDADQRDAVDTISTSGEHLLGVINDILDYSKIESGMLELDVQVFDLRRCVEDALEVVSPKAAEKRLDLVADFAPGAPEVISGDRTRVRQILVNYLSNAIKFTERGDVLVQVSSTPAEDGRELITVAVRDTGIGVPPERLDRLFQSFSQVDASTTRRYGGTGLGLAICKRLAELMGGTVGVSSVPGAGSTFTFSVTAQTHPDQRLDDRPDVATLAGKRLLVVDDNETNRRVVRGAAESWGLTVIDTASPREALSWLVAGEHFDLAALDYLMPELDGIELATAMRETPAGARLPMVLLSSVRRSARQAPVFDLVVMKPLRRAALLDSFLEAIGTKRGESAVAAAPVPAEAKALRILVAEDNVANQKVAARMLRSMGYEPEIVDNGVAAVAAVETSRYDVVLMDVHMPEMDGLEATRSIRRLPTDRQPHIFAMTASALDSEREECLEAGMELHIAKPIARQSLEDALRSITPNPAPSSNGGHPPAEEPVSELFDLRQLAESVGADGVDEIVDAIVDDGDTAARTLQDAYAAGDAAVVRRSAHTMKSNTAMIGAQALSDSCAELEALAKTGDLSPAGPLCDQVVRNYGDLIEALRSRSN